MVAARRLKKLIAIQGAMILTGLLLHSVNALAYDPNQRELTTSNTVPKEIQDVGVDEHRGQKLNLNLQFNDESGAKVPLGQFFIAGRPVVMAMVYFACPNLCNMQLNGMVDLFKKMNGQAGRDYEVIAVSMDVKETAKMAADKKAKYMEALGQPQAAGHWHFLTGDQANVGELAKELGFKYKWNDTLQQFAHASATYIVTPDGVLSRYLYGIDYLPETVRLSLVEASDGKVGTIVDRIALFCFQFSPAHSKYVLYSFNLVRACAVLTVLIMAAVLIPMWRKERKQVLRS